jgi:hypothetical protein
VANSNQSITPSLKHLGTLKEAGMGKRHIVFPDKQTMFSKLRSVLETEYSKLKSQDGAFELMWAEGGGYSQPICQVPMPSI